MLEKRISELDTSIFSKEVISPYKKNETGATQAYSYLLGYCSGKGLDLVEECILEV